MKPNIEKMNQDKSMPKKMATHSQEAACQAKKNPKLVKKAKK
jgi:hypothetical protein